MFEQSQPCQHGGRCIDQLGGFKCDCENTGFSGVLCQMNIDECASNPCQNYAKCEDKVNDYLCHCYPGYTGKLLHMVKLTSHLHLFSYFFNDRQKL